MRSVPVVCAGVRPARKVIRSRTGRQDDAEAFHERGTVRPAKRRRSPSRSTAGHRRFATRSYVTAATTPSHTTRGPLDARLVDLSDVRLRYMDDAGVDMQVLSTVSPGTQPLKAAEAVALARENNDVIAAAVAARPERFAGFATLPTPDLRQPRPSCGARSPSWAWSGRWCSPRTADVRLDDASFQPIFEVAAELAVPIYLHPQVPPRPVRERTSPASVTRSTWCSPFPAGVGTTTRASPGCG